jgi:hypothetical protein
MSCRIGIICRFGIDRYRDVVGMLGWKGSVGGWVYDKDGRLGEGFTGLLAGTRAIASTTSAKLLLFGFLVSVGVTS